MDNPYQKGKIYSVTCNKTGDVYIGHTYQKLKDKLERQEIAYKSYLKGATAFMSVFKIFENGDYTIALVEDYPCNSKGELMKREGEVQRSVQCINKKIEGGLKSSDPLWWKRRITCQCGGVYAYSSVTSHRLTRKHKNWLNPSNQKPEPPKKKTITGLKSEPNWWKRRITCGCGKDYNYTCVTAHKQTQHHKQWVESQT